MTQASAFVVAPPRAPRALSLPKGIRPELAEGHCSDLVEGQGFDLDEGHGPEPVEGHSPELVEGVSAFRTRKSSRHPGFHLLDCELPIENLQHLGKPFFHHLHELMKLATVAIPV